jgi:hypothetical protein
LRHFQRSIIEGLHRQSQISFATTRRLERILEKVQAGKTLWVPVSANLPGANSGNAQSGKNGCFRVTISGKTGERTATINAHRNLLRSLRLRNSLAGATLIGEAPKPGTPQPDLDILQRFVPRESIAISGGTSINVESCSTENPELWLSHVRGELACGSATFMNALASNSVAVLRDGRNAAPLQEGQHFIASDDSESCVRRFEQLAQGGRLSRIATLGRLWYERHCGWRLIASSFQQVIISDPPEMDKSMGADRSKNAYFESSCVTSAPALPSS